jgi:DNA-binding transcriptional ArsR family regulator
MDRKYDVFAAIGDPTRRQILMLLAAGSMSINTLAQNFEISRPAISRHVKLLEQAGLIAIDENGRERYCKLEPTGFNEVRDWLAFYDRFWNEKLSELGNIIDIYVNTKNNQI